MNNKKSFLDLYKDEHYKKAIIEALCKGIGSQHLYSFKSLLEYVVDKKYNLFLNIRDNKDYPFDNLFVIVSLEQPNRKVLVDTLEYKMAHPDGSLMGDGFSDVKENKLFYKEKFTFDQKGNYKVHIQHALRETGKVPGVERLNGITEVGFRIETTE